MRAIAWSGKEKPFQHLRRLDAVAIFGANQRRLFFDVFDDAQIVAQTGAALVVVADRDGVAPEQVAPVGQRPARQNVEQRALPRAVGTDDADAVARLQVQVHLLQHGPFGRTAWSDPRGEHLLPQPVAGQGDGNRVVAAVVA